MKPERTGLMSRFLHWLRQPVLGKMLEWPWFCRFGVLAAFAHVAFSTAGLHLWRCDFIEVTGYPCPGCGLTRSIRAIFRADWQMSLRYHAFGSVAIVAVLTLVLGAVLPKQMRLRLSNWVSKIEEKTRISQLAFVALWIYWSVRLIKMDESLLMSLQSYN